MNHYENVEAVPLGVPAQQNEPNVAQIVNLQQQNNASRPQPPPIQQYHPQYRNDVYDRNGGYDIPRNARNQNDYANVQNGQRRSNLHLDIRPRCPSAANYQHQRSFDDTESCYYGSNNGYNMYERIRDEPLYQNAANNSMYGRLDVIGHGIGRIERHLSSSCGNIDHYNVGGHYAVLSHSHINSMVMNQNQMPVGSSQNPREGVKSLFSCLGGENSQSMNSINDSDSSSSQNPGLAPASSQQRSGAIPKIPKNKQNNKVSPKPSTSSTVATTSPSTSSSAVSPPIPPPIPKANFSKSSLQYLLMNKWLPLGPDYKIIDFNFMFSRNCSPSGHLNEIGHEGVVQFNGQAEMLDPSLYQQPPREYPMMNNGQYPRIIRNTPQLSRLHETEAENVQYENVQRAGNAFRARSESPSFNGPRQRIQQDDPFRNWSFNFENNSFKPSGTVQKQQQSQRDGKRPNEGVIIKDFQEQNPRKELPIVAVEQEIQPQEPQPSTSKSTSPSSSDTSSGLLEKTGEMKKSENYDNLASLQHDPLPSTSGTNNNNNSVPNGKQKKKKSTESQSSDSVTLAEEDEDDDNDDPFADDLESDID